MARPDRPLPDLGLSGDEQPGPEDRDLIDRIWSVMSRWAVPVMMSLAYVLLAATSETNATGRLWMGVGLGFVFVVWFVFRRLADGAGLARALRVGDVARLDEIADRGLARSRKPAARGRFAVARGLARLLRGEPAGALDALDGAVVDVPELAALAAAVRIAALVELGRSADEAGALVIGAARAPALAWLAEGMVAWRADRRDEAARLLARAREDIRAGSAVRAIAHVYAARLAEVSGDLPGAAIHRAAAAALAMPEASWLRAAPTEIARSG